MKKFLSISLIFATTMGFMACSGEEEDIFDASAAERLNAASALYSARLTAQPNGWAMQYYPTYDDEDPNGAGYLLLCRFNKDYSVDVSGYNWPRWEQNYDSNQGSTSWNCVYDQQYRSDTSFWEVITDNGPVLSFNSYNRVMHYFSDPDYHETGTGFGGDYEFIITDAPEDASYMVLKGKKRGTYNLLTPVEEGVAYEEYLADVRAFQSKMFSENAPTGAILVMGDSVYNMEDGGYGLPSIYLRGTDKVTNESFYPFLITKRGEEYYIRFRDEITLANNTVQEFVYSKEKDIFTAVDNDQCFIMGDSIGSFFENSLYEKRRIWEWNENSDASESFAQLYTMVKDDFLSILKFTLTGMYLRVNNDVLTFRLQYRSGKNTQNVDYNFTSSVDNDKLTLTFVDDYSKVSTNAREKVASLQRLIDLLSGEWTLKGGETQFNLNTLKLVQQNDADMWFTINLR
ncbi:MAG: DUF4302 domain-containing protein [Prevotella sp.]|nr:DUF4302 domain-containing protein [Prevotella sp.]